MTDATPLASEQITQEDREAAAGVYDLLGFGPCQHIIDGIEDDIGVVQAFACHRIAALSATPTPSDQDASQAQGEVDALEALNIMHTAFAYYANTPAKREAIDIARRVLDASHAAPGATAQDVKVSDSHLNAPTPTIPAGMAAESDPFDDCLGIHVQANARRLAAAPTPQAPVGQEVERLREALFACRKVLRQFKDDGVELLSEGVHTGLRKGTEAPDGGHLWDVIARSRTSAWSDAISFAHDPFFSMWGGDKALKLADASLNPTTGAGETEGGK